MAIANATAAQIRAARDASRKAVLALNQFAEGVANTGGPALADADAAVTAAVTALEAVQDAAPEPPEEG